MKITIFVLYLLVVTPEGPKYEALESWRTWRECRNRALEFVKFAIQHPRSNVLGADCREELA